MEQFDEHNNKLYEAGFGLSSSPHDPAGDFFIGNINYVLVAVVVPARATGAITLAMCRRSSSTRASSASR